MLGVAIGLHQQGQFAQAGAIYQDIIRRNPANADARHAFAASAGRTSDPAH